MLIEFKKKYQSDTARDTKKHLLFTGAVLFPIQIGTPAAYLYRGKYYRTAAVLYILAVAAEYVEFETPDHVYTFRFNSPVENKRGVS